MKVFALLILALASCLVGPAYAIEVTYSALIDQGASTLSWDQSVSLPQPGVGNAGTSAQAAGLRAALHAQHVAIHAKELEREPYTAPVPEASSYVLMLLGLAVVGLAVRRRATT